MKKTKKTLKRVVINHLLPDQPNPFGWPPTCSMLLYQPERPAFRDEHHTANKKEGVQ